MLQGDYQLLIYQSVCSPRISTLFAQNRLIGQSSYYTLSGLIFLIHYCIDRFHLTTTENEIGTN